MMWKAMNRPELRPLYEVIEDLETRVSNLPQKYQKELMPAIRELKVFIEDDLK